MTPAEPIPEFDIGEMKPVITGLVSEEPHDRFEPLPRSGALYLHGVDDLSTAQITEYVDSPLLERIQWINDSACNLIFKTEEIAQEVAQTLLKEPTPGALLSHRKLVPARPYYPKVEEDSKATPVDLYIRVSTDEDIKLRGARARSKYYQIHGIEGQDLSESRIEARKRHEERMKKNGGDGRDVFSRLGQRRRSLSPINRRRSRSPVNRRRSRSPIKRRSRSPMELPAHIKSRLGSVKKEEE